MIINLLSNPRNVSTALMYSFAQRKDCAVIDEPFYAYYLKESGEKHPMNQEILQALPVESADVAAMIEKMHNDSVHLFVKNMAHHIRGMDPSVFKDRQNIIFIRHPKEVLSSFSRVIARPTLKDIAIKDQYQLHDHFQKTGAPVTVMDARDLLSDPARMLRQLCDAMGLDWDPAMLSWEAGEKNYDGVWAPAWYANVHESTGFVHPGHFGQNDLPDFLEEVLDEALEYYRPLYRKRLQL